MKTMKLTSLILALILVIATLCSCSSDGGNDVQKYFESNGYTVNADTESDYIFFNADKDSKPPRFTYIGCASAEDANYLFESDKQIVAEDFPANTALSDTVAYGEDETGSICCKVSVKDEVVLFVTYYTENSDEVDKILTDLGFDK